MFNAQPTATVILRSEEGGERGQRWRKEVKETEKEKKVGEGRRNRKKNVKESDAELTCMCFSHSF